MSIIVDHPVPGVRRLTIDSVARRGALSADILAALISAVLATPDDVACLVLTGTGTMFCAGYDLKELGSPPSHSTRTRRSLLSTSSCSTCWRASRCPSSLR